MAGRRDGWREYVCGEEQQLQGFTSMSAEVADALAFARRGAGVGMV
jgi:hypothetical protein